MSEIRMRGVYKQFGKERIIENVNLDIEDGEFVVFVGPSGCGKSTLLRLVAGLEDITKGDLHIGGKRVNNLPPPERGVAMVFQSYALYPHMTVYENMAFGLRLAKTDTQTIDERVRKAGDILQLDQLLTRLPKELSGGQRQRVAIGRAIVREPGVFLFDEPLSNLDAALRVQTRIEIAKLHSDLGASMIYVTHDQVEAMTLANKIVLLNAGEAVIKDGSVAQVGSPLELYHQPCNKFVAGFIGSPKMNFIDGELVSSDGSKSTIKLPDGSQVEASVDASAAQPGMKVTLGIRPEHFDQQGASSTAKGKVAYAEHLGEASLFYLELAGSNELLTLRKEGDVLANRGDMIEISIPRDYCHLFNDSDRAFPRTVTYEQEMLTTV
ncbi:MAG: sn-glycerol-3-phosphate ABC transporter ATP-binding protein UgpC [SAR324 cluster bacterium]|nr:sn-glycerol-3-phosphate ABC transporter ATP-binding protein UgpC [SAR324 cluster bacterium]